MPQRAITLPFFYDQEYVRTVGASLLFEAFVSTWGGMLGTIVAQVTINGVARKGRAHDFKIEKYTIFWPLYALFAAGAFVDCSNNQILIGFDDYIDQLGMAVEVFAVSFVFASLLLLVPRGRRFRLNAQPSGPYHRGPS